MTTEHNDDISGLDVPMIVTIGLISTSLTVAMIFGVQALYYRGLSQENERKVIAVTAADSDSRVAEQKAQLTRYAWLDRDQGKVAVPIERAMNLVVKELKESRSQ